MHGPIATPDTINATPDAILATKPNSAAPNVNLSSPKSAVTRRADHNPTQSASSLASVREHQPTAETAPTTHRPHQSSEDSYSTFKPPASPRTLPEEPPATASDASATPRSMGWRSNRWLHYAIVGRERGMSTAEYAVGTIAACAFAALLFKVVSSPEVQEMLSALIDRALKTNSE
ncbi:MAG TPA: DUF4244 domain-containing protein [Nonomuraea sp.]|nr:DUF4244 domain-containing protein [Nonomuraea sp.]